MTRSSHRAHRSVSLGIPFFVVCRPLSKMSRHSQPRNVCHRVLKYFIFKEQITVYFRFYLLYSLQMTKPHIFIVSLGDQRSPPMRRSRWQLNRKIHPLREFRLSEQLRGLKSNQHLKGMSLLSYRQTTAPYLGRLSHISHDQGCTLSSISTSLKLVGTSEGSRTLNPSGHLSLNQMCMPFPPHLHIKAFCFTQEVKGSEKPLISFMGQLTRTPVVSTKLDALNYFYCALEVRGRFLNRTEINCSN